MSKIITILAIDRAEAQLKEAVFSYKKLLGVDVKCYLLINKDFKSSPAYYGNECPDLFEEIEIDFKDTPRIKEKIEQICKDTQVVTHCRMEEAIKDFELLIPLLDKSFNQTIKSLEMCTHKSKMRKAMIDKYPEIAPKFITISNEEQLDSASFSELNFPVIIKPNGLHSSYLVLKCSNLHELKKTVRNIFPEMRKVYAREYGTGEVSAVIEEFMVGKMYSVDVYINNEGKVFSLPFVDVVTSADVGKDGYYGYEFSLPSDLSKKDILLANQCVNKCIDSVGLTNSVGHIELYKTVNGWKIIEIGPRMGGYRHNMYQQAFGIDHFLNDLLIHTGKNPIMDIRCKRYSGCINIYPEKEGTITRIAGVNQVSKLESIIDLGIYVNAGDFAKFASNGGKMVADITFGNDNLNTLKADISTARRLLKFDVE
jgi:biotin carboxylase